MNVWLPAATSFLASAVEAVEALTIVLAVGVSRSWRAALSGAGWALATLALIVAVFGPAIVTFMPLGTLKMIVGTLLLIVGMAWLRKAILRYSGRKALHDEAANYARETRALLDATPARSDRLGFITAYNAVLLEGLEVAVIVVTFGAASAAGLRWAALGAAVAVVAVAAAGVALRKPLSRVPENSLKFIVGVMLTSFGTFWCGEGLGIMWWRADLSLGLIVAVYLGVSALTIVAARRHITSVRGVV